MRWGLLLVVVVEKFYAKDLRFIIFTQKMEDISLKDYIATRESSG